MSKLTPEIMKEVCHDDEFCIECAEVWQEDKQLILNLNVMLTEKVARIAELENKLSTLWEDFTSHG